MASTQLSVIHSAHRGAAWRNISETYTIRLQILHTLVCGIENGIFLGGSRSETKGLCMDDEAGRRLQIT